MFGMYKELIIKFLISGWDFIFNFIILKRFGLRDIKWCFYMLNFKLIWQRILVNLKWFMY